MLQIAAGEIFGADQWSKLDANTVQLGHPDAYVAMTNAQHEVRNHFAIPPFTFLELKNVPGAHVVLSSPDIMGGAHFSQAQFFTTTKFADANPKIVQAVRDATKEAQDLIRSDTRAAVEIYKEVTGDKTRRRGFAGVAGGARHDGVEPEAAGHHEVRRASIQDRHAEDHAEGLYRLLPAGLPRSEG